MSTRPSTAVVIVAFATLGSTVLAGGCRQVAGIEDRAVAARCSAATYQDRACGECTEIACCAELERCAAQAACASAYDCIARCAPTDQECRSSCRATHAAELGRELAEVLACQSRECTTACSFACAGNIGSHASCAECFASRCCEDERACNRDADCLARRFCRIRCDADPACTNRSACNVTNPGGKEADDALQFCQSNTCAVGCTNWTCLGRPTPSPTAPVHVVVEVFDAAGPSTARTGTPVPGIRVRACGARTVVCDDPADPVVPTDADGRATFVFDARTAFDGHFVLTSDDPAWVPTIAYPWRPLATDGTVPVRILRAADLASHLALYGVTPSPDHGHIAVHVRDCAGAEAAGVALARNPPEAGSATFYFASGGLAARGTASTTDGKFALGGFFDVAPALVEVTGALPQRAASEPPLKINVPVLAGTVTFIDYDARR